METQMTIWKEVVGLTKKGKIFGFGMEDEDDDNNNDQQENEDAYKNDKWFVR